MREENLRTMANALQQNTCRMTSEGDLEFALSAAHVETLNRCRNAGFVSADGKCVFLQTLAPKDLSTNLDLYGVEKDDVDTETYRKFMQNGFCMNTPTGDILIYFPERVATRLSQGYSASVPHLLYTFLKGALRRAAQDLNLEPQP